MALFHVLTGSASFKSTRPNKRFTLHSIFFPDAAAGASNDYGYASTPEATYNYVVELRDTGEYGFLLPADQIEPTGEESYDGVIALLKYIIDTDYM